MEDEHLKGVATGDQLGRVDVVADRELTCGDDALGLVADVEQNLVVINRHHGALHELAVLDVNHG